HPEAVVKDALPDEGAAKHVDHVAWQDDLTVVRKIGVGQIDVQRGIVFLDGRAQKHRPATGDAKFKPAQEPRSFVIEPLLAQADALDVAVAVKNGKSLTLLEHVAVLKGARRGRQNVELILDLDDFFHSGLFQSVSACRSVAGKSAHNPRPSARREI